MKTLREAAAELLDAISKQNWEWPIHSEWRAVTSKDEWLDVGRKADALRAALAEEDKAYEGDKEGERTCGTCKHWDAWGADRSHCSWLGEKTFATEHKCADDHWTPREGGER